MFSISIGNTDITPYVGFGGIEWTRNDIDGANAGRTISGLMIRDRIATKDKIKVTCRPLTTEELTTVLTALEPEYLSVSYTNPRTGSSVTKTMYCSSVPVAFSLCRDSNATTNDLWGGIAFSLIER